MNATLRTRAKQILSKMLPDSRNLTYLAYLPRLETFRKNHVEEYAIYEDRYRLYDYINEVILKIKSIDYIELGVFKGASIKYWASINTDIKSRFYGFDTFTGLPEPWDNFTESKRKGFFETGGEYPEVDDARVSFIQGLFQDTLPAFLKGYTSNNPLVIHFDCDLYSATLYVLTHANSIIVPGTIILFDEFSSMLHEFRAFEDYCSSYMRSYEIIGASDRHGSLSQIAIKMK